MAQQLPREKLSRALTDFLMANKDHLYFETWSDSEDESGGECGGECDSERGGECDSERGGEREEPAPLR